MVHYLSKALILTAAVAAAFWCCHLDAQSTFSESFETPYNHITVEKIGRTVEMSSRWRSAVYRESAVSLSDPTFLLVPYTRLVFSGVVFRPSPGAALMIGLGGGAINDAFCAAFPKAVLTTVELDPKVVDLAKEFMAFRSSDRNQIAVDDGRIFLKHTKASYDWIILDAFRGGYVPPHLKTVEFYRQIGQRLTPNGIMIANLHTGTKLFECDLRTISEAFSQLAVFKVKETDNAIAVAANFREPSFAAMLNASKEDGIPGPLRRNLKIGDIKSALTPLSPERLRLGTLLTDDFAPTEFYDVVKSQNGAE